MKDIQAAIVGLSEEQVHILNMYILKTFYMTRYESSSSLENADKKERAAKFYGQFYERLKTARTTLALDE